MSNSPVNTWRVPTKALGKLLDHGKISAYAVHLLAIKCSKGPTFALNERSAGKYHGICRRNFQAGIRLLKEAGVLERTQPNRRATACEVLVEAGGSYVPFPESLLEESSKVVAFVLAVSLARGPRKPAEIAERIGITSDTTIRKLTRAAIAYGCAWNDPGQGRQILLARRGYIFDPVKKEPAKKEPAKNGPAHSSMRDSHDSMREEHDSMRPEHYSLRGDHHRQQDSNHNSPRNDFEGVRPERRFRGNPYLDLHFGDGAVDNMLRGLFDLMCDVEDTYHLSDGQIIAALKRATDGRIGNALLTEEGIDSARRLIAAVMGHAPGDIDEDLNTLCLDALDALCSLIWQRVGSKRDKWLNSWRLITLPLTAMIKRGDVGELYNTGLEFAA